MKMEKVLQAVKVFGPLPLTAGMALSRARTSRTFGSRQTCLPMASCTISARLTR